MYDLDRVFVIKGSVRTWVSGSLVLCFVASEVENFFKGMLKWLVIDVFVPASDHIVQLTR